MRLIKQAGVRPLSFLMIDSTDGKTGKTGLTPTVTLSKDTAAFAAPAGVVAEIGVGWYKLTPTVADTGVLGVLMLHATAAGADMMDDRYQVVPFDPEDGAALGLSRLDAAVTSRLATAGYTAPDNADIVTSLADLVTLLARVTSAVATNTDMQTLLTRVPGVVPVATDYTAARALKLDFLDVSVLSRLSTAGYTAPDNADIVTSLADLVTLLARVTGAVATNVDMQTLLTRVPGVVAAQSGDSFARMGAPAGLSLAADIAAIIATYLIAMKGKTDQLTFTKLLELDANVRSLNAIKLNGVGTLLTPWGP